MKIKELLRAIENLSPETEIEICDQDCYHKAIWVLYLNGVLILGHLDKDDE